MSCIVPHRRLAAASLVACLALAAPVAAAPIITGVSTDISASTYSFSFMGGTFTVTARGSFPNYLSVSTSGTAAVRTVFGGPSTDFPGRGYLIYDQNIPGGYGSFSTLTTIGSSNGPNLLGLRVTSGGQNYYGFLYTSDQTLNSYGFETVANAGIIPTTDVPAAQVPEPASWAMMIAGFGMLGGAMRRRRMALRFA